MMPEGVDLVLVAFGIPIRSGDEAVPAAGGQRLLPRVIWRGWRCGPHVPRLTIGGCVFESVEIEVHRGFPNDGHFRDPSQVAGGHVDGTASAVCKRDHNLRAGSREAVQREAQL